MLGFPGVVAPLVLAQRAYAAAVHFRCEVGAACRPKNLYISHHRDTTAGTLHLAATGYPSGEKPFRGVGDATVSTLPTPKDGDLVLLQQEKTTPANTSCAGSATQRSEFVGLKLAAKKDMGSGNTSVEDFHQLCQLGSAGCGMAGHTSTTYKQCNGVDKPATYKILHMPASEALVEVRAGLKVSEVFEKVDGNLKLKYKHVRGPWSPTSELSGIAAQKPFVTADQFYIAPGIVPYVLNTYTTHTGRLTQPKFIVHHRYHGLTSGDEILTNKFSVGGALESGWKHRKVSADASDAADTTTHQFVIRGPASSPVTLANMSCESAQTTCAIRRLGTGEDTTAALRGSAEGVSLKLLQAVTNAPDFQNSHFATLEGGTAVHLSNKILKVGPNGFDTQGKTLTGTGATTVGGTGGGATDGGLYKVDARAQGSNNGDFFPFSTATVNADAAEATVFKTSAARTIKDTDVFLYTGPDAAVADTNAGTTAVAGRHLGAGALLKQGALYASAKSGDVSVSSSTGVSFMLLDGATVVDIKDAIGDMTTSNHFHKLRPEDVIWVAPAADDAVAKLTQPAAAYAEGTEFYLATKTGATCTGGGGACTIGTIVKVCNLEAGTPGKYQLCDSGTSSYFTKFDAKGTTGAGKRTILIRRWNTFSKTDFADSNKRSVKLTTAPTVLPLAAGDIVYYPGTTVGDVGGTDGSQHLVRNTQPYVMLYKGEVAGDLLSDTSVWASKKLHKVTAEYTIYGATHEKTPAADTQKLDGVLDANEAKLGYGEIVTVNAATWLIGDAAGTALSVTAGLEAGVLRSGFRLIPVKQNCVTSAAASVSSCKPRSPIYSGVFGLPNDRRATMKDVTFPNTPSFDAGTALAVTAVTGGPFKSVLDGEASAHPHAKGELLFGTVTSGTLQINDILGAAGLKKVQALIIGDLSTTPSYCLTEAVPISPAGPSAGVYTLKNHGIQNGDYVYVYHAAGVSVTGAQVGTGRYTAVVTHTDTFTLHGVATNLTKNTDAQYYVVPRREAKTACWSATKRADQQAGVPYDQTQASIAGLTNGRFYFSRGNLLGGATTTSTVYFAEGPSGRVQLYDLNVSPTTSKTQLAAKDSCANPDTNTEVEAFEELSKKAGDITQYTWQTNGKLIFEITSPSTTFIAKALAGDTYTLYYYNQAPVSGPYPLQSGKKLGGSPKRAGGAGNYTYTFEVTATYAAREAVLTVKTNKGVLFEAPSDGSHGPAVSDLAVYPQDFGLVSACLSEKVQMSDGRHSVITRKAGDAAWLGTGSALLYAPTGPLSILDPPVVAARAATSGSTDEFMLLSVQAADGLVKRHTFKASHKATECLKELVEVSGVTFQSPDKDGQAAEITLDAKEYPTGGATFNLAHYFPSSLICLPAESAITSPTKKLLFAGACYTLAVSSGNAANVAGKEHIYKLRRGGNDIVGTATDTAVYSGLWYRLPRDGPGADGARPMLDDGARHYCPGAPTDSDPDNLWDPREDRIGGAVTHFVDKALSVHEKSGEADDWSSTSYMMHARTGETYLREITSSGLRRKTWALATDARCFQASRTLPGDCQLIAKASTKFSLKCTTAVYGISQAAKLAYIGPNAAGTPTMKVNTLYTLSNVATTGTDFTFALDAQAVDNDLTVTGGLWYVLGSVANTHQAKTEAADYAVRRYCPSQPIYSCTTATCSQSLGASGGVKLSKNSGLRLRDNVLDYANHTTRPADPFPTGQILVKLVAAGSVAPLAQRIYLLQPNVASGGFAILDTTSPYKREVLYVSTANTDMRNHFCFHELKQASDSGAATATVGSNGKVTIANHGCKSTCTLVYRGDDQRQKGQDLYTGKEITVTVGGDEAASATDLTLNKVNDAYPSFPVGAELYRKEVQDVTGRRFCPNAPERLAPVDGSETKFSLLDARRDMIIKNSFPDTDHLVLATGGSPSTPKGLRDGHVYIVRKTEAYSKQTDDAVLLTPNTSATDFSRATFQSQGTSAFCLADVVQLAARVSQEKGETRATLVIEESAVKYSLADRKIYAAETVGQGAFTKGELLISGATQTTPVDGKITLEIGSRKAADAAISNLSMAIALDVASATGLRLCPNAPAPSSEAMDARQDTLSGAGSVFREGGRTLVTVERVGSANTGSAPASHGAVLEYSSSKLYNNFATSPKSWLAEQGTRQSWSEQGEADVCLLEHLYLGTGTVGKVGSKATFTFSAVPAGQLDVPLETERGFTQLRSLTAIDSYREINTVVSVDESASPVVVISTEEAHESGVTSAGYFAPPFSHGVRYCPNADIQRESSSLFPRKAVITEQMFPQGSVVVAESGGSDFPSSSDKDKVFVVWNSQAAGSEQVLLQRVSGAVKRQHFNLHPKVNSAIDTGACFVHLQTRVSAKLVSGEKDAEYSFSTDQTLQDDVLLVFRNETASEGDKIALADAASYTVTGITSAGKKTTFSLTPSVKYAEKLDADVQVQNFYRFRDSTGEVSARNNPAAHRYCPYAHAAVSNWSPRRAEVKLPGLAGKADPVRKFFMYSSKAAATGLDSRHVYEAIALESTTEDQHGLLKPGSSVVRQLWTTAGDKETSLHLLSQELTCGAAGPQREAPPTGTGTEDRSGKLHLRCDSEKLSKYDSIVFLDGAENKTTTGTFAKADGQVYRVTPSSTDGVFLLASQESPSVLLSDDAALSTNMKGKFYRVPRQGRTSYLPLLIPSESGPEDQPVDLDGSADITGTSLARADVEAEIKKQKETIAKDTPVYVGVVTNELKVTTAVRRALASESDETTTAEPTAETTDSSSSSTLAEKATKLKTVYCAIATSIMGEVNSCTSSVDSATIYIDALTSGTSSEGSVRSLASDLASAWMEETGENPSWNAEIFTDEKDAPIFTEGDTIEAAVSVKVATIKGISTTPPPQTTAKPTSDAARAVLYAMSVLPGLLLLVGA